MRDSPVFNRSVRRDISHIPDARRDISRGTTVRTGSPRSVDDAAQMPTGKDLPRGLLPWARPTIKSRRAFSLILSLPSPQFPLDRTCGGVTFGLSDGPAHGDFDEENSDCTVGVDGACRCGRCSPGCCLPLPQRDLSLSLTLTRKRRGGRAARPGLFRYQRSASLFFCAAISKSNSSRLSQVERTDSAAAIHASSAAILSGSTK